jgi:hypothetical protein
VGRRSRKARAGTERPSGATAPRDGAERRAGATTPRDGAGAERPDGADRLARGYARGRQRDEEARAKLKPLAPGERPLAVTIAAVVAFAIAAANLVLYLAGWDVRGQDANLAGALAVCLVFAVAGVGMWRTQYWAVIGFEVLLGVLIVSAALSLMLASNLGGALLSIAVIVLAGPLFWFLIRAMARIQMPQR